MIEGNSLVQYGHQVAQKYSMTGRPRCSASDTFLPSEYRSSSKAGGTWPSSGTSCRSNSRSSSTLSAAIAGPVIPTAMSTSTNASATFIEPPRRVSNASSYSTASGPQVDVALLDQLHDAHDAALRQLMRARGQLLEREAERLHRVAAGAEHHSLPLQLGEHGLELWIDARRHERLERRPVDDELDGLDVARPADARDRVLDVAEHEARLVDAGLA